MTEVNNRNGDSPIDLTEVIASLTRASDIVRTHRDNLAESLAEANAELSRYARALTALTDTPKREPVSVSRSTRRRRQAREPGISDASPGYSPVSSARQQRVLEALKAAGVAISAKDLATRSGITKTTVQNALPHLRARQLVRLAGTTESGSYLYATYDSLDQG